MSNPKIKFKRSSVHQKRPSLVHLEAGELGLNTFDGKLFTRQDTSGVGIGTTITLINPWNEHFGSGTIDYIGTVGIGTTNPQFTLDVDGDLRSTGTLQVGSDSVIIDGTNNTVTVGSATTIEDGGINVTGVVTATTFDGNLATTNLTGTISNDQLAGSINNSKLDNSSISFGGVILDLGQADPTPAFDLSDATNYPFENLSGITTEIVGDTTPQLGGDLDVNGNDITGTGNINLTGDATFSGNVSIAGTLTYEDVTNVDSVGLITARKGVRVDSGGLDVTGVSTFNNDIYVNQIRRRTDNSTNTKIQLNAGQIKLFAGNGTTPKLSLNGTVAITTNATVSGVLTANSFSGDGSTLSGVVTSIVAGGNINVTSSSGIVTISANTTQMVSDTLETTTLNVTGVTTLGGDINVNGDIVTDVNVSGVVSATSFTGDGSTLSGVVTSITAGDNISIDSSTGNVTITGIAATSNINADTLVVTGVSTLGTVTATTYFGDGSNLTGVQAVSSTTRTVNRFVATQGQTLFPPSGSVSYDVGYIDVFLNGGKLDSTEFTATNGTTITLTTGASEDDIIELVAFSHVSLTDVTMLDDTSPQLGGDLDLNDNDITGTGNIDIIGDATFSGNVTIGGTLTCEDVKNIDSIGIVTARTGVIVNSGGLDVTGVSTFRDDVFVSGIVSATEFNGSLATTNLTGTITNDQLAGSINNSKLDNSSISFGGVSLDLGQADPTPAFDLSDATNYPFTSLSGITTEIVGDTTPQLGGNLDVNGNDITGTGDINLTGVVTATSFVGDGSGLTNVGGGDTANILADTLVVTGVSTLGVVTGATYYGDGSNLTGVGNTENVSTNSLLVTGISTFNGTGTEIIRIATQTRSGSSQEEFGIGFAANVDDTNPAALITYQEFDDNDFRGELAFYTRTLTGDTAPTEKMRITKDGDIGIGTNNPNRRLDVRGSGSVAKFGTVDPSGDKIEISVADAGYPKILQDSSSDTLSLSSSGSIEVAIDSNNNSTGKVFNVVSNGDSGSGTDLLTINEDGNSEFSGIVTATSFSGSGTNLTGIVTSITAGDNISIDNSTGNVTITGLANTANVSADTVDTGSLNVTGVTTLAGNTNISGDITSNVTIVSTDTGSSAAPEFTLYRNSASPAPGDYLGQIMFKGENSNGGEENYAKITGKILDETLGTEDGLIETAIKGDGSFTIVSRQRSDQLQLLNGVGLSVDGDSTFTGGIDVDGHTELDNVNVSGAITATTFTGALDGNSGTATALENARNFSVTGDFVTAPTVSFDGTSAVALAATITADSITLGTYTSGDYVESVSGTANEIQVTSGTGEGSTPTIGFVANPTIGGNVTIGNDLTVTRDLQVTRNLSVDGTVTIGGTSATIFAETLTISDPDLILGFRTDANGNDISNDSTASHGGIALASTEGSPLINLVGAGETLAPTYKKIMWFKTSSFAGLSTDAWLSNYAFGVGTTSMSSGTKFAVGNIEANFDDFTAVRNINSSGVITATSFTGNLTGDVTGNLTGTATNADNIEVNQNSGNTFKNVVFVNGIDGNLKPQVISSIQVQASTGILTATKISGDGSLLTGLTHSQVSGAMGDLIDDTTPQLGGELDLNGNNITGTSNIILTGSGRIGVGTNAPDTPLDVRTGSTLPAQFVTTTGSSNGAIIRLRKNETNLSNNDKIGTIQFAGDNGTDSYISEISKIESIVTDSTNGSEDGDLTFFTSTNGSSTEKVRINSSGNVGVGTNNPSQRLHLSSNANQTSVLLDNVGTGGIKWYLQSSANTASNGQGNFTIYNGSLGSTAYTILGSNNNIGIAKTNPIYELDVEGDIGASGAIINGITTSVVCYGKGGNFNAGTDNVSDAGVVINEDNSIYTKDGAYLRNLIEKKSDIINIGQQNTSLIDGIHLKPGTTGGQVKLHAGGGSDNVKLETNSSGVVVTGVCTATSFSGSGASLTSIPYSALTGTPTIPSNNNELTNGAGYITGLSFDGLSSKTSGTGEYSTNSHIVSGRGSGGVALTINDGYGNANVTFNHKAGTPEQNGKAGRIEVNTDSTSGSATMSFELGSATANTAAGITQILLLSDGGSTWSSSAGLTFSNRPAFNGGASGSTSPFTVDSTQVVSNLNADLLDGVQGSNYLRSDESDTFNGVLSVTGDSNQLLLKPAGTEETVILRNDGSNFYILLSAAGSTPSGTWTTDRPFRLNNTTADLYLANGKLLVTHDTASLTVGDGSTDCKVEIKKADDAASDHLEIYNGTTLVGQIGCQDTTWLRINQGVSKNIYTPRLIRADGGFQLIDGKAVFFGTSSDAKFYYDGPNNDFELELESACTDFLITDNGSTRFTFTKSNGNFTATGNVTAYSDINLKKNIEVIPDALNKVSQLRGVTFDRIDIEDEPRQSGVIAQEVEKVLPEVVRTTKDGMKTVAYGNLVGLLIESIKELKEEVETLKAERN